MLYDLDIYFESLALKKFFLSLSIDFTKVLSGWLIITRVF